MVRVILKNTFLSFDDEGETPPEVGIPSVQGSKAASPRSRSVEIKRSVSTEFTDVFGRGNEQIDRLNRLFSPSQGEFDVQSSSGVSSTGREPSTCASPGSKTRELTYLTNRLQEIQQRGASWRSIDDDAERGEITSITAFSRTESAGHMEIGLFDLESMAPFDLENKAAIPTPPVAQEVEFMVGEVSPSSSHGQKLCDAEWPAQQQQQPLTPPMSQQGVTQQWQQPQQWPQQQQQWTFGSWLQAYGVPQSTGAPMMQQQQQHSPCPSPLPQSPMQPQRSPQMPMMQQHQHSPCQSPLPQSPMQPQRAPQLPMMQQHQQHSPCSSPLPQAPMQPQRAPQLPMQMDAQAHALNHQQHQWQQHHQHQQHQQLMQSEVSDSSPRQQAAQQQSPLQSQAPSRRQSARFEQSQELECLQEQMNSEQRRVRPALNGQSPTSSGGNSRSSRWQMDSPSSLADNRKHREYRHSHVPKTINLEEEYGKKADKEAAPTTLMIRNIPNHFTQKQLIAELESLGFNGSFDFLYIPLDKGTMSNVGYAFVNFVTPEWAAKCMETFQDYRFKRHRKVAATSIAHLQGLEANLAHYENSAVSSAKLKQRRPVVMANISNQLCSSAASTTSS